jgi:hypothetical protein
LSSCCTHNNLSLSSPVIFKDIFWVLVCLNTVLSYYSFSKATLFFVIQLFWFWNPVVELV